jgi:uncharacterized protein YrrD
MLIFASKLNDTPVISVHAGGKVATITRPLINPHDLTIVGFFVDRAQTEEPEILLLQDIREWSSRGVVIDHDEEFARIDDLPKLKQIISISYELIEKKVYTESHKKLGTVEEFVVDSEQFTIQKLHVKRNLFRALADAALIISRSQIKSVNDDEIIVEDATLTGKLKSVVNNAVPNPLARPNPQAERVDG